MSGVELVLAFLAGVLLVLDVAVPDYGISPGILLPLLGAILLTNKAYGYPTRGSKRRRKPTILA